MKKDPKNIATRLVNILADKCYNFRGPRWHDAGQMTTFHSAIEQLFEEFEIKAMVTDRICNTTSRGTAGNISDSVSQWTLTVRTESKTVTFEGEWFQIGGANVKIDGMLLLKAYEKYGKWEIGIHTDGLQKLYETMKD